MIFGYFWNDPYNHVKIGMKDGANNVRGGNMMIVMKMVIKDDDDSKIGRMIKRF